MPRGIGLLLALAGCAFDSSSPAGQGPPPELGEQPADAPASCAAILAGGQTTSAVYWIDPDGEGAFAAYCEMETDGGGWNLALKADGVEATFRYSSQLWTTPELLAADSPDLDRTEAKLDTFNRMPLSEVMIRFETLVEEDDEPVLEIRRVWMDLAGESLLALVAPGEHVPVFLGREQWLDAVPSSSLPDGCQLEGVNAGGTGSTVRIGIVASDEEDCAVPESKLGVGNSFTCASCGSCDDGPGLAGPAAGSNDAGCRTVIAFASIFVR